MDNINKRLKQINIEYLVWIIYFIIIGLSMLANSYEKKYFLYNDICSKEKYRNINTIVFVVAIIIYFYFVMDSYDDIKDLKANDSKKKKDLTKLSFLGSLLILISGIIFLYIIREDYDIETEIAFN